MGGGRPPLAVALPPGSGKTILGLEALAVFDPDTSTASAPASLASSAASTARAEPACCGLAGTLTLVPGEMSAIEGSWSSRRWVPHVTRFFESGDSHTLVGTRGLLGEGWDARRVTGLVDLTSVTTTTAVVQTRGRALPTDPAWATSIRSSRRSQRHRSETSPRSTPGCSYARRTATWCAGAGA